MDDGSFNAESYKGVQEFVSEHEGATVTPVQEKTSDTAALSSIPTGWLWMTRLSGSMATG